MTIEELLPVIIPLLVLQVVVWAIALYDLSRPDRRVRGGSKLVWALVILLGQLLGGLVYFLVGREDA